MTIRSERGSGLLSTAIGVAVMIAMLGFAANVSLGLWTRSTVDAVAYDAARQVATTPVDGPDAALGQLEIERTAIDAARGSLGRFGDEVDLEFEHGGADDVVVLHVRAPGVGLLPRMLGGGAVVGAIDRRIVIRREATS